MFRRNQVPNETNNMVNEGSDMDGSCSNRAQIMFVSCSHMVRAVYKALPSRHKNLPTSSETETPP